MKKYRRIEITAFRRRVSIISGELSADNQSDRTDTEVLLSNADSSETIETESEEGQRILTEAIRLLEEKLVKKLDRGF